MSTFISKPQGGWIHSDKLISKQGATYAVRYVGCLEVQVSMKTLDFKMRSSVAKECINKVCEVGGLKTADKKRKVDKSVLKVIAEAPCMTHAGENVVLNISSSHLSLISHESSQPIASHDMPHISFASGGDCDTLDFVGYIAKDKDNFRACYVLECGGGLAKDIITTIGQAFELRFHHFKQSCRPGLTVGQASASNGGEADKDYYNDLPGKIPPDVGPPPVPPLPAIVAPFTTLPPVQSPNFIDFNSEFCLPDPAHHYVNDELISRDRDVFDMQPFANDSHQARKAADHLNELQNEWWFHGQISRADAEKLLKNDGDFLVRESPNSEGQFVLSGIQNSTKKHLLLIDPEGVIRTRDRTFGSVSHLINFHFENVLPIISAESVLVLRTPVRRAM